MPFNKEQFGKTMVEIGQKSNKIMQSGAQMNEQLAT
jgi:hypothetical protein